MTNKTVDLKELKTQMRKEIVAEQQAARQEDIKNQFQLLKAMTFRGYAKAEDKSSFTIETKKFFADFVKNWFVNNNAFEIIMQEDLPQEDGSVKHVYLIKDMNILASGKTKTGKDFYIYAPAMPVYKTEATA